MFGFGFRKVESISLEAALAAKSDEALRVCLAMLPAQDRVAESREEIAHAVCACVTPDTDWVLKLLIGFPELIWKVIVQALDKGPQTLDAPSALDAGERSEFFDHLAEMYGGMFFVHVFPERAEGGAPRIAVVEEVRKAWKDSRKENLARREAYDRICTLAEGAANLYGCLDVARFAQMVGATCTDEMPPYALRQMLELRTSFGDGSVSFSCRDGEILHVSLADDSSAHARVRRAHVGKDPRAASVAELLAAADEDALLRTDLFKSTLKTFSRSLPKALAGEAENIVEGFAHECRSGADVAATMAQLSEIVSMSGDEGGQLDCAALTPLYNGVPLWEEFGRTREEAGKAQNFSVACLSRSTPHVNTGPQVGRNDPCPCGSGKKFKKCCGRGL